LPSMMLGSHGSYVGSRGCRSAMAVLEREEGSPELSSIESEDDPETNFSAL